MIDHRAEVEEYSQEVWNNEFPFFPARTALYLSGYGSETPSTITIFTKDRSFIFTCPRPCTILHFESYIKTLDPLTA